MSENLREPPAKKRKSRFGPQATQDKPYSSNSSTSSLSSVADDLQRRQRQALAVAANLSKQLGLDISAGGDDGDDHTAPNASSFLETASLFSGGGGGLNHKHHGLGYGKHHEERVYIPKDDYPDINFIGLILGPKGLNQKRMQSETGCRILVKGKGSSKNGIPDQNDPEEPLHVYISADTKEKVEAGVKRINDLIRESTDKYEEGGMDVKVHRQTGYIDVEIPNCQIGVVIGKQGNNIQRIQEISGATIDISASNVPDNPLMKMITITGNPHQCEHALREVHQTIAELRAFRARLKRQREAQRYHDSQQHDNHYHHRNHHRENNGHYGYHREDHHHGHHQPHHHNNHGNHNNNNHHPQHHHEQNRDDDGSSNGGHHRDYGTASYDPNFNYPESTFDEESLPTIAAGAVESGFCEIVIPNSVVGLIIGKNASNVKAMKDRTRCDIRVQKDEETLPDSDTRLVALRGCVQSIKAARQEIAKVIHMANAQKQGATLQSMQQQNYQQMMQYQNQMMYQQMMYQQQMGYGGQYQSMGYPPQSMDPAQQQAYYAQWQQHMQGQQQPAPHAPQHPTAAAANPAATTTETPTANTTENKTEDTAGNDDKNGEAQGGQYDPTNADASTAAAYQDTEKKPEENATGTAATTNGAEAQSTEHAAADPAAAATTTAATATPAGAATQPQFQAATGAMTAAQQQQQYQQMLQYGWTPQQIAAYQQYPQYYQQYYQQYAQQYPQWAQYQASMQAQMQQQQEAVPPPPPPPPEEDSKETSGANNSGEQEQTDSNAEPQENAESKGNSEGDK